MAKNSKSAGEVDAVYKAKDGEEFATPQEAKTRNELLAAKADFERASSRIAYFLGQEARTADGFPFEQGCDYYWSVRWYHAGLPVIGRVNAYRYESRIEIDHDGGHLILIENRASHRLDQAPRQFKISELYRLEVNAKAAHLALCEQWLEESRKEIDRLKARDLR